MTQVQKEIMVLLCHRCLTRNPSESGDPYLWVKWIQKNFNKQDHLRNDQETRNRYNKLSRARYSIEVIFEWSPLRIISAVMLPLLLSLAIGIWYMKATGDVVGAWTISLYIVTTAAGVINQFLWHKTC